MLIEIIFNQRRDDALCWQVCREMDTHSVDWIGKQFGNSVKSIKIIHTFWPSKSLSITFS